jgi:hypothetical protein
MNGEISVDVYNSRHPEPHSMVLELLHVNGWKSGTDTYTETQIDREKRPVAVLLQFIAISPRRGPLAYFKIRVYPCD